MTHKNAIADGKLGAVAHFLLSNLRVMEKVRAIVNFMVPFDLDLLGVYERALTPHTVGEVVTKVIARWGPVPFAVHFSSHRCGIYPLAPEVYPVQSLLGF